MTRYSGNRSAIPIKDLNNRFKCVKCDEILRSPVKQLYCGHRICQECFINHTTESCPGSQDECRDTDLQNKNHVLPDTAIERDMTNDMVSCKCKNTMSIKDYRSHEKVCCIETKFGHQQSILEKSVAMYDFEAQASDELSIKEGDILTKVMYVALYDFDARTCDELSIKQGDILVKGKNSRVTHEDYIEVTHSANGTQGLVPINYVQLCTEMEEKNSISSTSRNSTSECHENNSNHWVQLTDASGAFSVYRNTITGDICQQPPPEFQTSTLLQTSNIHTDADVDNSEARGGQSTTYRDTTDPFLILGRKQVSPLEIQKIQAGSVSGVPTPQTVHKHTATADTDNIEAKGTQNTTYRGVPAAQTVRKFKAIHDSESIYNDVLSIKTADIFTEIQGGISDEYYIEVSNDNNGNTGLVLRTSVQEIPQNRVAAYNFTPTISEASACTEEPSVWGEDHGNDPQMQFHDDFSGDVEGDFSDDDEGVDENDHHQMVQATGTQKLDPMPEQKPNRDVRILLVGTTGSGKSSSGNTILSAYDGNSTRLLYQFYKTSATAAPETKCNARFTKTIFGRMVTVVDTPGANSLDDNAKMICEELEAAVRNTDDGYNAIVYVIRIFERDVKMDDEEIKILELFKEIMGNSIMDYVILLFTHGSNYEKMLRDLGTAPDLSFEEIISRDELSESRYAIGPYVQGVQNRAILFENKNSDGKQREVMVRKLLEKVDEITMAKNGELFDKTKLPPKN